MKTMNMISRRSFLKAAMAAATVSALGLTGCGSSASSTASGTASSAAASSAAASEVGQTFKVGIVNYVDHASLNQIVASVEERLDEVGKEKGVTFDYADYYANAQADQTNLNQIGADLVADGVDVIVAVATPPAQSRGLASVTHNEANLRGMRHTSICKSVRFRLAYIIIGAALFPARPQAIPPASALPAAFPFSQFSLPPAADGTASAGVGIPA